MKAQARTTWKPWTKQIAVLLMVMQALGLISVVFAPRQVTAAAVWQNVGDAGFSADEAYNTSLYISNGIPYVAYQDKASLNKATVMRYVYGNWETVGSAGFSAGVANYTSLYIDNGTPYVAYSDGGSSDKATVMKYVYGNWETVGSAGFSAGAANYTSLYISNGTPYVAYQDAINSNRATVMKYNGNQWVTVGRAGFSAGSAYDTSLYVENGTPYVAYKDEANSYKATVMKYVNGNWETVGSAGGFSAGPASNLSLYVDYGTPYVAYSDEANFKKATVMKVVNLPDAPANPQNLVATGGDRQVALNWSTVTGATYYNLYMAPVSGQYGNTPIATVTDTTYHVQNLTNGTVYYFIVKAGNLGGVSAASNEVSATPKTVPAAPTNVTATAGNGQATVTFTAPTDNGGDAITGYEVTASPGNITVTGTASPITIAGLTNGTSYTFTVKAINGAGSSVSSAESNAVIPRSPSSGSSRPTEPTTSTTPETANTGVDVLVNGKVENVGTATTTKVNDQTVTTIAVDQRKLEDKLAAEGLRAVVTIPVNTKSDVVVGELNGQMVKNMEQKQAVVEIKTDKAAYTLPAQQINIDSVAAQIGKSVALQDIKVQIEIAEPTADTVKVVENAAAKGTFTLVAPPLNFTVRGTYGDTTIEVSKFNTYVERTIAIPDGADPGKITTAVVVEPDGTLRHVPTKVVVIDGKYYAKINSLTNSTYSVIWHPLEFRDVANHWAKDAVNDMGSRMVISGIGNGLFSPDRDITRAEFAAIVVRGLGLKPENGAIPFSDVKVSDWYSSAINTAYAYRLISGFEDGTFRPNDKITREQAMVIIAKAMTITDLKARIPAKAADEVLSPFADATESSNWAKSSIADCLQAGIVSGRSSNELAPKEFITRAEVAAIVQRLLQKSELI